MTIRFMWAAMAALALLPFTTGTAHAGTGETPDGDRVGGPVASLRDTNGDELIMANLGWVNSVVSQGALDFTFAELTGVIRGDRPGTVNVDLAYGDHPAAPCISSARNTLVDVDLDPAWALILAGRKVPPCPRPSLSDQMDKAEADLFKRGRRR